MNKSLNILFVHNKYKIPGGEDTVVENEIAMLEEAGHHIVRYIRSNTELDSYSVLQKLLLPFQSVYSRKTYRDITQIIKDENIDLVHVHNTLTVVSPSVYYAALAQKIPVIQTIHNFRLLCPGALFYRDNRICTECVTHGLSCAVRHKCYRNSKVQSIISAHILSHHRKKGIYSKLNYICLTDFNRQQLLKLNHKGKKLLSPDQIYIKPNFTPDPLTFEETPVPYTERSPYFLYLGRMDDYKGIYTLLNAWAKYESECSDSTKELYLCGSGDEFENVKEFISKHALQKVRLLGQTKHAEAIGHLKKALALCLPTHCFEGFPMVISESYACGTPVIGSNLGNVGNLVEDGRTGFLHDPNDSDRLADYFINWDKDYSKTAANCSVNCRHIYLDNYTEEKNQKILSDIYHSTLAANKGIKA